MKKNKARKREFIFVLSFDRECSRMLALLQQVRRRRRVDCLYFVFCCSANMSCTVKVVHTPHTRTHTPTHDNVPHESALLFHYLSSNQDVPATDPRNDQRSPFFVVASLLLQHYYTTILKVHSASLDQLHPPYHYHQH